MSFDRKNALIGTVIAALSLGLGVVAYIKPPSSGAPESESVHRYVPAVASDLPSVDIASIDKRPVDKASVHGDGNLGASKHGSISLDAEQSLEWLATGISRASLQERFGVPRFESPFPSLGAINLVYVFPRFFLQAVVSKDGTVSLYSVTTRDTEFRPSIPKLGGRLLEKPYAAYGSANLLTASMGSKYSEYLESIDSTNATNFRTIYLGDCPAGVWLPSQTVITDSEVQNDPRLLTAYREKNAPNCFGVGAGYVSDDALITDIGKGLDYFQARDLTD